MSEPKTPEELAKFLQESISKGLKKFVGEPLDTGVMKAKVKEMVEDTLGRSRGPLWEDGLTALSELFTTDFCGMPEDFDPKALLARVNDLLLHQFAKQLTGEVTGASAFLFLEFMKRKGDLQDWRFTRTSETAGNLEMLSNKPIEHVELTYVFEEEKP